MKPPFLLLLGFFAFTCLAGAEPLPSAIEQSEQQLLRAPSRGAAFDAVLRHFAEGEGLDKLAARWKAKAEANTPDAGAYWRLLSLLSDREGHETDAIEFSQKAADLAPADPGALGALADALLIAARSHDAIETLEKALAVSKTPEARIASYKHLAYCRQRASDAEGVLRIWRQLIQEFPADTAALGEAGDAMTDAERYADAQSFYEASRDAKGITADQKAKAIFKLAQLAEIQHADDKARDLYASAIPLVAADSWIAGEARLRIEDSFRKAGDLSALAAWYESWLGTHSQDIDAALRLGGVLSELERKPEAIAWLKKAADLAPARKDVKIALAELLIHAAQPQEAVEVLRKLAAFEDAQPGDHERLADAEWQLFQATNDEAARKAAVEAWRRLAPASEKNPDLVLRAAQHLGDHGMANEALPLYERAASLAPDAPEFRERWADYLTSLKRDADARKVLHGIVEGPRATASDFLRLARLWRARNDRADALLAIRAGLDLDPENFELLSFEWTLLAADNHWQDAANLAGPLIESAPSLASAVQVEDNHAQALRKLGKLGDTLHKYAQRLTNGPPPSETELRLLVALALRDGNLDLASKGLEAAARLFPNSAALVYDRAEYERRKGHLKESVAALQRLSELQPEQKTAWLRRITRVYQDEQRWDSALAAAQRLIDADPTNPDSFALAADIDIAARHFDAGVARLREAIQRSREPGALRLKLAQAYLRVNSLDEARAAFESAFTMESDPVARVGLAGDLADAFARSGRFDELIARFRHQRAGKDGWRYALYLSEIFRKEFDLPAARQELMKAFGPRSRDVAFLTQSLRISADEHSPAEGERCARLLADADPGDARQIELVFALSANGEAEEALRIVESNRDALFKDPLAWHDALIQLTAVSAGPALANLLQSGLARRADDWRIRLLLAEAQMHNGDVDSAAKRLREIESLPPEAAALPPSSLPAAAVNRSPTQYFFGGVTYSSGASGAAAADFTRRIVRGYAARRNLAQIASALDGPSFLTSAAFVRASERSNMESFGLATIPQTLGEAADAALVMRSVLAQRQGRGPAFLAALEGEIKAQPRSERLAIFALVQALDPLMKEIADEAAHPSGDEMLSADCLEILMSLTSEPSPAAASVNGDLAGLIPLLQTFLQRERRPGPLFAGARILSNALLRAGRVNESQEVTRDVLTYWFSAPRSQDFDMFQFAMENGELKVAENILALLAFDAQRKGALFGEDFISPLETRFAEAAVAENAANLNVLQFLYSALRSSWDGGFQNVLAARGRSIWNPARVFLKRSTESAYQIEVWSEIFHITKRGGLLREMMPSINGPTIRDLPSKQSARAKLARICFLWWDNRRDDAAQEIVKLADAEKSDQLHLIAASMLADQGRPDEARKALDQVWATSGDAGVEKLVRLLELARAANDMPKAKQIALQLADLPLSSNDRPHLEEILNQLGLPEKAAELSAADRERWQTFPGAGSHRLAEQLQTQVQAKHESEAIGLARLILSRPAPEQFSIEDNARRSAIAALKQFNALSAYIDELEGSLTKAPNSAPTLFRLAEASDREQPEECIDYYRRLVRLEPDNMDYQSRLARTLSDRGQREEAMRIWEMILSRRPEAILGNNFFVVFSAYQSANQMARLGDALLSVRLNTNPLAPLAFNVRDASDSILQVADVLRRNGNVEDAIRLWRAALERRRLQARLQSGTLFWQEADIVKRLVSALLDQGRRDEAIQELETYFFPPAEPESALGFDVRQGMRDWMFPSYGGEGFEFRSMPLIRLAVEAGALQRLRSKAVAAANPRDPATFLVLLIDIAQRDLSKICSLKTEFNEALHAALKPRNPPATSTLFLLARTLGEWPAARPLALWIEQRASDPSSYLEGAKILQQAQLAAELGENKVARQALRDWSEASDRKATQFDFLDFPEQLSAADLMSRVGMATEAGDTLRKLRAALDVRNAPDIKLQADELSSRLALLAGENDHAQIAVWTAPRTKDTQRTTVFWEIGAAPGKPVPPVRPSYPVQPVRRPRPVPAGPPADAPAIVTGEDLPELDGRFSIELFAGPTPSALEPLATIPAAKMRGAWVGAELLPEGYLVAILRDKGAVVFTQKTFVPGSANQLANPDLDSVGAPKAPGAEASHGIPGWPDLNPADIERSPDAPNLGGSSTRFGLLNDSGRSTVPLQRIPLEQGRNYYFTGWLRAAGNGGRAGISGQFLDKDGKPVGRAPSNYTTISGRWVSCAFRLTGVRIPHRGMGIDRIPEKAAYFEPQIYTGNGQCEMSGLYFGEIFPEPGAAK